MANKKEYEMLFQLNAQLGNGYNSTFSKAKQQISAMQEEIETLSKTQSDIAAFQKQQSAVEATDKKLKMLQQQYDNIQNEINETEGYSSNLENRLLSKKLQLDQTTDSLTRYKAKLDQTKDALKNAGVNTEDLTGASAKLETQINALKVQQEETADGAVSFGEKSVAAIDAAQQALAAAGIAAALHEIYEAYMECVTIAGDFQESMSNVEALSSATADEMELLSEKAKDLGAATKFTAQEASDAMGYMAMAGWDAQEMLSGMDGVLQLAAASGEDLAMVSDIVTDNLTAFGLTAADTAHFSDVLAAAATNANTDVSTMGETFKQSASVAGALGYSIEDVAVAVGLMANAGVKGSSAGTALKNTFNGLLEGVTLTGNAFGEFEYSAVKADGTMKFFSSTVDELRGYFEQMTEAERVNNATVIAGQYGYNGLLAILNATDEDYASLTASINSCTGAAEKMAAVKLDNMNGELTIMQSAWDGLKITLGEQFTPVVRKLYHLGTELFSLLNSCIQEHPALIKGMTTFIAVIGAATLGLTGFSAAVKIAIPLIKLLSGSIPGVNVAVGIAAAAAAMVGLVSAANEGVSSVKELTEAARGLNDALEDTDKTYRESVAEIQTSVTVAEHYISRLEELEAVTSRTDAQQTEWHNTLALLANAMPELAESIDLTNDVIDGGTAALRTNTEAWKQNAEAQAYQEYMNSVLAEYNSIMEESAANSMKLMQEQIKLDKAQQKLTDTYARMDALWEDAKQQADAYYREYGIYASATKFLSQEYDELQRSIYGINDEISTAERAIQNYNKAISEDEEALAAAKDAVDLATEAWRSLTGATEDGNTTATEAAQQQEALSNAINSVMAEVNTLAEAYNAAYDAALQSVSGQYELWDNAAGVVATSAGSINAALESQMSYWKNYNANLQALSERTADIEGLGDIIASFADGSSDSVNAIAGMAGASDAQLRKMVSNWKALQEEQKLVSDSIALLKEDFTAKMDELQTELAEDIAAMDMGDEAADAGQATINGFIDGASGMLPQVKAAYSSIAQAGMNALVSKLGFSSLSSMKKIENVDLLMAGFVNSGGITGYAVGTRSAAPGIALVGENGPELVCFNGGERVLTARETAALQESTHLRSMYVDAALLSQKQSEYAAQDAAELIAFAPQLFSAIHLSERPEYDCPEAESDGHGGSVNLTITFHVEGNATPETVEALRAYGDDFAARVLEVIEEADIDAKRRAYL